MNRDELVAAYAAPGRHYHNLAHIEDCLGGARARRQSLGGRARNSPRPSGGTMSFTTRPGRTTRSSARNWLNSTSVRTSSGSRPPDPPDQDASVQPDDRLGAILISIDLSILGAEPVALRRLCRGDPAGVHSRAGGRLSCRSRQGARPVRRPAGHLSRCRFCRGLRPAGPRQPRARTGVVARDLEHHRFRLKSEPKL